MELKRDIYKELLAWKSKSNHKVLELEGARQVGKTYILEKFAKKEYQSHVYINMIGSSGKDFLQCLETAASWEPGKKRENNPVYKAFQLYDPDFSDCEDLLIVIDEIQESSVVYSKIREFARDFKAHFIVTGSYLGKTREKEYFLSAGDTEVLTMTTLTFPEFLDAFHRRGLYESIDLYGGSDHAGYDELKSYFHIYLQIGGYPEVVTTYLESRSIPDCEAMISNLIQIFVKESSRYFDSPLELQMFEKIFSSIAATLLKEKKGTPDLTTDLTKIIFKEESGRITKKMTNYAISWLFLSHQIGYCSMSVDCSNLDIVDNCRYYFNDLGVAGYFLKLTGEPLSIIEGVLCENFVYLELVRRIRKQEIAGQVPWFAIDKRTSGELDFYVRSRIDNMDYGLEVKRGKNRANTANALLERGKLDFIYQLKNTYGGIEDRKYSVPLYLCGRIPFNLGL
ncbi:ATP-binding protein [Schaedlerella sp.]|jgi:predicted AAA+ superfamily ATPase|uniref:ATP-binding protein n=1 Tax=Schaedlerella sp. TaxID=2676057 RepID=UPI002617B229|nr:AAA family ATPase [uncultured Schaedlerella sp.]MCI8769237.1 AAA family ATPase [Ruminococcus sp.]